MNGEMTEPKNEGVLHRRGLGDSVDRRHRKNDDDDEEEEEVVVEEEEEEEEEEEVEDEACIYTIAILEVRGCSRISQPFI